MTTVVTESYAARAERFAAELARDEYRARSGQQADPQADELYARAGDLFERSVVGALLRSTETDAERATAWFAAEGYLAREARDLTAEFWRRRRRAELVLEDGRTVPYLAARALAANEPHPRRRRELEAARIEAEDRLNEVRADRLARQLAAARDLGFDDLVTLYDRLRALDLAGLATRLDRLVEATDDAYFRGLTAWLQRLGIPRDEALPADLAHLFRAAHFDSLFPAQSSLRALQATLKDMAIDFESVPGLTLDGEPRPGRTARAFVAPIRVPGEVVLAWQPQPGHQAYRGLFEAAGSALHLAHADPAVPFPLRMAGDPAAVKTTGRLFGEWLCSPRWIRDRLGVRLSEARDYLDLAHFHKLSELRRLTAQLRFETTLLTGDTGVEALYAEVMTDLTGLQPPPEDYLAGVEDGLTVAEHLRAALAEVALRRHLESTVGENWFQRPEGGAALTERWAAGAAVRAEPLAGLTPESGLDADLLIEDLLEPRD